MFSDLTKPNKLTTLDGDFRWTFDPTNNPMFRKFETGYSIFLVLSIPNMLAKLTEIEKGEITGIPYKSLYSDLIASYIRTLEREYKRLDGLDNISSESIEFTGLNEVSVNSINKTDETHNPSISLVYTEQYASVLTRVHELFLKGIDDPIIGHRKHYNGLIDDGILAPSFKNEVFSFLYIITDNTGLQLERAYYFFNAQPTTSYTGELYNSTRGEYEYKELTLEYKCNMLSNQVVFNKARTILEAITGYHYNETTKKLEQISIPVFSRNSVNYKYRALTDTDRDFGVLNYPREDKDISYIQAHVRQLGVQDDIDINGTSGNNINTTVSSQTKTYIPEEGDTHQSTIIKEIEIDTPPVVSVGDSIYIKNGATLASCVGHKTTPNISTFKTSTKHVYEVVDIFSTTAAKSWAQESKNGRIYHSDSTLFAYVVKIDGKKKSYLNARDFYIKDGKNWADPETKLKVNVADGSIFIEDPLYQVGDIIKLKPGAVIYDSFVRQVVIAIPVDEDREYEIIDTPLVDKVQAYAELHKTNYPYSDTNFHPYVIYIDGELTRGFISEQDIILVKSS